MAGVDLIDQRISCASRVRKGVKKNYYKNIFSPSLKFVFRIHIAYITRYALHV